MTGAGPTSTGPGALPPEPALREAALALNQGRTEDAERGLRQYLQTSPGNPNALRMLAEVAIRANSLCRCRSDQLGECLAIAPQFIAARYRLATLLFRMNKPHRALEEIEHLLADDPDNFECLSLGAVVLARMGNYAAVAAAA